MWYILLYFSLGLGLCYDFPEIFASGGHRGLEHVKSFNNEWTVEVPGGPEVAQLLALEFGYVFEGEVLGFPGTYVFRKDDHSMERRAPSVDHTTKLSNDARDSASWHVLGLSPLGDEMQNPRTFRAIVKWAEQLYDKSRVKRNTEDPDLPLHRIKRLKTTPPTPKVPDGIKSHKRYKRYVKQKLLFNDELWSHEWYLQDTRTEGNLPRIDLNVLPVYKRGYNGSGVRVSVLDDGIEHTHTDLKNNYDPEISWDCNDGDPDPTPRYEERNLNSHGTRCAGEIAMTANNVKCGVGVAWGARVGGVRMLDGRVTDRVEGEALGYAWDKVDVYSASWGPNDDGRTVEGPGRLAAAAILRGITKGRGGKGSIYVWANGNGGSRQDNCNCDGYSSSIYTISIGSASQHGFFPWYGEVCASTLATAYSSGAYTDQKIATTDTGDTCTLRHTGTSAAAPLAAGIIALALQANPDLTWRDVQHLIVWTSEYTPLAANKGWLMNNVGLRFDVRFGFGLLNAEALVAAALNWTRVPEKTTCRIASKIDSMQINSGAIVEVLFKSSECDVKYAEHVELIVNVEYTRRGALQFYLASPRETKIQLLSSRPLDMSSSGFMNWSLTSVATWGENPQGVWSVTILDETSEENEGVLGPCTLVIHGTRTMPDHMKNGPRKYNDDYNESYHFNEHSTTNEAVYDNSNNCKEYGNDNLLKDDTQNILELLAQTKQQTLYDDKSENILANIQQNPTILAEVEKELLRIHHRMTKFSGEK